VCNGRQLLTPSGERMGAVVAMHDITERKRAETENAARAAELTRSNEELEQFAYIASHDLQAPLRSVSGFAQMLQRNYQDKLDKDANEYIQYITESALQMQRLISDLLAFSRIGRSKEVAVPTNLEEVLAQVQSQLQGIIDSRAAQITHDPLPTIDCVPLEINQLLQNLISNGLKFQPGDKPRVHVSARKTGATWTFSVRDYGIGISPEHHRKIFQIFQRLHTSDQYEGTGIGLALCKKIVERHGGKIWLESEPGHGATFYFTLPARATKRQAAAVEAVATHA
jgi:light-regulated signal transduction histidine kinase (bacteriophytochrome)